MKYGELGMVEQKALNEAIGVLKNSYEPYSRFRVGACLISRDDRLITGANFENAAYGSAICAERAAVLRANAMGIKNLKSIVIVTAPKKGVSRAKVSAPCGSCRQVLYEASQISGKNLGVILSTVTKGTIVKTSIAELLPLAFGPDDVGVNIETYRERP